jgi:hypothetical protein
MSLENVRREYDAEAGTETTFDGAGKPVIVRRDRRGHPGDRRITHVNRTGTSFLVETEPGKLAKLMPHLRELGYSLPEVRFLRHADEWEPIEHDDAPEEARQLCEFLIQRQPTPSAVNDLLAQENAPAPAGPARGARVFRGKGGSWEQVAGPNTGLPSISMRDIGSI